MFKALVIAALAFLALAMLLALPLHAAAPKAVESVGSDTELLMLGDGRATLRLIDGENTGMVPFPNVTDGRVSFFLQVTFVTENKLGRIGDQGLVLSTVRCSDLSVRRVMTKKLVKGEESATSLFPHDQAVASTLQALPFQPVHVSEEPQLKELCALLNVAPAPIPAPKKKRPEIPHTNT